MHPDSIVGSRHSKRHPGIVAGGAMDSVATVSVLRSDCAIRNFTFTRGSYTVPSRVFFKNLDFESEYAWWIRILQNACLSRSSRTFMYS